MLFLFSDMGQLLLQQKLAQMLSRLIKIAEEFNVAVYMTNQGNPYQFQRPFVCSFISNYSHVDKARYHTIQSQRTKIIYIFFRMWLNEFKF